MTKPLLVSGLAEIADRYEAVLCDVWGVVHNGVAAFAPAVDALARFRRKGGRVVLLTNAPRPAGPIHGQLAGLGVPRDAYDEIVTSGDVTRELIIERPERAIVHIGHERDLSLYEGLDLRLVDDADGEVVVVTGLVDDEVETPEDYRARLTALAARGLTLISANPDIVVERGEKLVWCAGALGRLYEELGGAVVMVGKPFPPIYTAARRRLAALAGRPVPDRAVLAIGDGLPTDIRGAHGQALDVLFVTGGIHAADFGPADQPDMDKVAKRLTIEGLGATAAIPRLAW
jgi:HAD superfamily hydrolase (TIGR01459 family)